ncbi:nuclear transport factor 2 family protein [Nocardia miyunensis]|uniref:nuclear transport factor 2 family protein n=1 Tax=Nocardia miyunensis TaxID=282684 RepID=UPI00082DBC19|nr:nuclear transport factor 2 family protein [Nocardia miyunensis]
MPTDDELRAANIDIARRYLDAINAWDFEEKRRLLADDVVFEMRYAPPGFDKRITGKEDVLAFVQKMPVFIVTEGLYDISLETYHSDPGEVIAEYKSDMTLVVPVEMKNEYVTRFTIRDGKITRFREYFDPIVLIEALGGQIEPGSIEATLAKYAAPN